MPGKNSISWSTPLFILLGGLFISSFFVPFREKTGEWIPLLSGFVDLEGFYSNKWLLAAGGIASIALLLLPVCYINSKAAGKSFRMYYSVLFCLLLVLINPMSLYFSTIYPAAILLAWMQYCILSGQRFTAFFLLSLASLFYAPVFWSIPIVLVISLIRSTDFFRAFFKSVGGVLLPWIYLLSFRYIYYNDLWEFVQEYARHLLQVNIPVYSLDFVAIFVFICLMILSLHVFLSILGKLHRQNIFTGYLLRVELATFFFAFILFALYWGVKSMPLCVLLAPSFALLLSHFYSRDRVSRTAKAELVLLMGAAVVARVSYFL